jgi:hypothetical protein
VSVQQSPFAAAAAGQAPEVSISRDIVKRGLMTAPAFLAVSGVIWGLDGALSSAFGLALVLVNFSLAAALIGVTAPISLALMMGVSLFGYLVRLGLISLAVFLVRDASWVSLGSLGATIIVSHLGLLFWEMKYIAASLAFPGLRPNRQECPPTSAAEKH